MDSVFARTPPDVDALREPWLGFVRQREAWCPACDPDRLLAGTAFAGEAAEPFLLLARGRTGTAAVVAGTVSTRRLEYRLGYRPVSTPRVRVLSAGEGGVVHDGTPEAVAFVARALRRMLKQGEVDAVALAGVSEGDPLLPAVKSGCRHEPRLEPRYVERVVPGSFAETMARHRGRNLKRIRWSRRRLEREFDGRVRLRIFDRPEHVDELLRAALPIADRTWQRAIGGGLSGSAGERTLLDVEARCGRLLACVLEGRDRPIAYLVGWRYGHRYFAWMTGYLPEFREVRPGFHLFLDALEVLCGMGVLEVDLGLGETGLKRVFSRRVGLEAELRLFGGGLRAQAALLVGHAATFARRVYRRLPEAALGRVKTALRSRAEAGG